MCWGGGDYSREAINRGTASIRGNTIKERKRYEGVALKREVERCLIFYFTRDHSDIASLLLANVNFTHVRT